MTLKMNAGTLSPESTKKLNELSGENVKVCMPGAHSEFHAINVFVTGKLQQAEQLAGQQLLQEMSPKVQEVLRELIATEGIGLLLQRASVIQADAGYSITAKVTDKLNQLPADQ